MNGFVDAQDSSSFVRLISHISWMTSIYLISKTNSSNSHNSIYIIFRFYNHALHLILDMEICDDDEDLDQEGDEEGSNNNEWR